MRRATQPAKLLPRVLTRVLPITVLTLVGLWLVMSHLVSNTVTGGLNDVLEREAEHAADEISSELAAVIDAATGLAANDLVINGLIDFDQRSSYLPIFFQSLRVPGPTGARVSLADYRGRAVASNTPRLSYEDEPWIAQVMAGERFVDVDEVGIVIAVPVLYSGQAEGIVVIEHGADGLAEIMGGSSPAHAIEVRNGGGVVLFTSDPEFSLSAFVPELNNDWIAAEVEVPAFPGLRLAVGTPREEALATARRLEQFMLLIVVLGALAVALGVWATAYFATKPLGGFIAELEHVQGAKDLHRRIKPGGAAEFHDLAATFNRMLGSLNSTTTSRDYMDAVLNSMHEMLFVTRPDGLIETANRAALGSIGATLEDLRHQPIESAVEPETGALWTLANGAVTTSEGRVLAKDGRTIPVEVSVSSFTYGLGGTTYWIFVASDITERKRARQELEFMAQYDALTGLANRTLFRRRLDEALANARRTGHLVAVMLLDLDHFKDVNDYLGHPVGDALLRDVSQRLTECARETDTVARLGGDEFAIIATNINDLEGATVVADKVISAIAAPFMIEDHEIRTGTSVGISVYPWEDGTAEELLKHADFALYQAKRDGRGSWQFYDAEMNAQRKERKAMEDDLRHAIERDELSLVYQPKIHALSGQVTGVEALLRWTHGERGSIPPAEFIPISEATGQIASLTEWVLDKACAQHLAWQRVGLPAIPIAVNLSATQFRSGDVADIVCRIVTAHGIAPPQLELEITEGAIVDNVDSVIRQFRELHELGHEIVIDDFGTGYSSLAYLKNFPANALKIDKTFVANINTSPDDAALARAIIALAASLDLGVIAEGVETEEQLAFLRQHGCREVQGYLYQRPVPPDAFADWYRKRDEERTRAS